PIIANFRTILGYYYQKIIYRLSLKNHLHIKKTHLLNLNTKIVLSTTFILIVSGAVSIAFLEWNNAFASMSISQKLTQSIFCSVTPRTAGFNNIDTTLLSNATLIITIILMWIGGASQSTAGGVKINAFTTALLHVFASARGKRRLEIFGREIPQDSISRSNIAIIASLIVITISLIILTVTHPNISPSRLLFEIISALGTVGLSMNTTPLLSDFGKIIITLLMFSGRIGILSIVLCVLRKSKATQIRYPKDNIIIN
ncbi:MAG: potassium transporter TrkG, partial [Rikenellaceae bacterium]